MEQPEYDEIISYWLIQQTFIQELCILKEDPLGPGGPNLKTFPQLNDQELWKFKWPRKD